MADIEELKKLMVFVRDQMCHKTDCRKCDYNNPDGICYSISDIMRDALSVIEEQQAEIERLKAQKQKWLQTIADQQLAVSPTGYETEEELAKRTGEWNGLQMAWEILTEGR